MKKVILFAGIAILFTSCWPMSKGTIMRTYDCYDGKDTGIESLININGYYTLPCWSKMPFFKREILFYNNGIFVSLLDPASPRIRPDGKSNVLAFFNEIIENPEGESAEYWKNPEIGRYTVNGDIIKIQYNGLWGVYSWGDAIYEYYLKIIDHETLVLVDVNIIRPKIGSKSMVKEAKRKLEEAMKIPITFTPLKNIPPIDHHPMLRDKRFLCK